MAGCCRDLPKHLEARASFVGQVLFLKMFFRLSCLFLFSAVIFPGEPACSGWEQPEGVAQCRHGLVSSQKESGPLEVSVLRELIFELGQSLYLLVVGSRTPLKTSRTSHEGWGQEFRLSYVFDARSGTSFFPANVQDT